MTALDVACEWNSEHGVYRGAGVPVAWVGGEHPGHDARMATGKVVARRHWRPGGNGKMVTTPATACG
jgi:hypothetical protein